MAKRRPSNFNRDRDRERFREPRINHRINAPKLRVVIDGEGQQVMERDAALRLAQEQGLDLVEVSPDQDPPVCKIIDYGKYKYEQQKKKKDQIKNQHIIHIKEIKLRPKIAEHDYELKKRNALSFLEKGDKVKVTLRFRGREITHPELGMQLLQKMAADVGEIGAVETPPKMEGRQIVMVLASRAGQKSKKVSGNKKEIDENDADESVTTSSG
ncbi:MAG: translation initiation factor IF-3 [Leptospiraceae bacterium]|nr:translation initiation factor IF-3 [Leptospiraceae bacterium]